jgi:hypothetical protein
VAERAKSEADPRFVPFKDEGPDAFQSVESMLSDALGGGTASTTHLGIAKDLAMGMLTAITQPIAVVTDEYQVDKIRELQQAFLRNHEAVLTGLDESLSKAKASMRGLEALVEGLSLGATELRRIFEAKRRAGNAELWDIDRALEATSDPEERARLQAMKDDLEAWMDERDRRVEAEAPEVAELRNRLRWFEDELYRQRRLFEEAGRSAGPRTQMGRAGPGAPLEPISTTHTRPDAVAHVTGLYDMMLASKAALDRTTAR